MLEQKKTELTQGRNFNQALEWDRLITLAESEARSEPAKKLLNDLRNSSTWAAHLAQAQLMQQELQEITPLLERESLWGPLLELPDPAELLDRLGRDAVLEILDLSHLRRWLNAIDSWTQIPREDIRSERLKKTLASLPNLTDPLRLLDKILTPEGDLSEKASPRLAALHSEIRGLKREIGIVLDQLLKTFSQKGVLQENFSDVRDGRYVLPIKISSQNEVEGIIYEASASRQTVFVEPKEVSLLNNRLRQRQNDLIQEIYVVLEAASKQLRPHTRDIQIAVQTLCHWDVVQAKARLGRRYSGKPIKVTEDRCFFLKDTAHPLLWWSLPVESIIRNEIYFSQPTQALLLTGPNTGGKTVLLKTLGIAGICARTGFPFPASETPIVPFFDAFFADLGDPQSIEQQLSSFSGHVLKFKEILENLTLHSLILIDELNSATDPDEGAAFGRAILETLLSKNAMMVTTTHDPQLKAMALSDQRILNASMQFDEKSRTPTYRMNLGIPGRSRALETAERLGIPQEVITLAKKYLSQEHVQFEQMLSKLESDTQEATRARKEAVSLREEAERLKKEWTQRTESSVTELMEKTRQRLRRLVEQAQDEIRATVKKLDEMRTRRDIDKARGQLNEVFQKTSHEMESALEIEAPQLAEALSKKRSSTSESTPTSAPIPLEVGLHVRIPKWKNTGVLMEILGNKVKVAMGKLQFILSTDDIEPLEPALAHAKTPSKMASIDIPAAPPSQLDLRGLRYDDAMAELEKYLDLAFRSGALAEVTIVHGLGTGALREGTLQFLKSCPFIKTYRNGGTGRGGTGATIVEFDR